MKTYSIIRYIIGGKNYTIKTGLTLKEAQDWFSNKDRHGEDWFANYQQGKVMHNYESMKKHHDETKPIRGRSIDVRPIGKRTKDSETIEMVDDVVACKLYRTEVVKYYPDGRIGINIGGWRTRTTMKFIERYSPFYACKRFNRTWIETYNSEGSYGHKFYPVPTNQELIFKDKVPQGNYFIQKKVINRERIKAARDRFKPFLDWAKMFLSLSDGIITSDTITVAQERLAVMINNEPTRHYRDNLITFLTNPECHLEALVFLENLQMPHNNRVRYLAFKQVKDSIEKLVRTHDVFDYVEAEAPSQPMPNYKGEVK